MFRPRRISARALTSRVVLAMCFMTTMSLFISGWVEMANACPFCSAQSQTFTEEINSMDVAVIAKLVKLPLIPKDGDKNTDEVPKAKFEILQAIKGKAHLANVKTIETVYYGDAKVGKEFMIMGVDPVKTQWSTPTAVSERVKKYILTLQDVPAEGAARLKFFQDYLEDSEEMLARDAYDEFAKTPYAAVNELKKDMKHDQLVSWIKDPNIPASRRRLYLTMLGVCGTPADATFLEEYLKSSDKKVKSGLDALIACYLTLKGPDGMAIVEDLYLKNTKSEYADTYSAIMALRFHGSETHVIPKARLLEGLRYMLDRPQLADLVIPDLARWEDWSQMDRLVKLFKEADEKSSWVRVPVVNFLRACPLPEAKTAIQELEKIDPGAVKRANTFFPSGTTPTTAPVPPKTTEKATKATVDKTSDGTIPSKIVAKRATEVASANRIDPATSALVRLPSESAKDVTSSNRLTLVGVTWVAGAILMLLQWTILRGNTVA